jgi:hypothetical protein
MRRSTRSATAMDKFESSYRALASLLNARSSTMAQPRQRFSKGEGSAFSDEKICGGWCAANPISQQSRALQPVSYRRRKS